MTMDSQKAVCVEVDGSRTIVQGIDSETTAKDVISALRLSREMLPGPFVLLEVWKGCCRRVEKEERICSLLEQWGNESRNVRLVVMSSYQYNKKRRGAEQSTALYRAQTHGKVATRRRRIRQRKLKTKRTLATEVQGMLETLKVKREELLDLTTAKQQNPTKEMMAADVPPGLEEEYDTLQEELEDEKREHSDLVQRRGELMERIQSQERELDQLKKNITTHEAKVFTEQRQLAKVVGFSSTPELEEAQKEVIRLQNELKVRTKLNQLQSSKMQELGSSTPTAEVAIQHCTEQIDKLKLELGVKT